eukprot:COSAG06_NODE_822_length_12092_cov_48.322105_7_plen_81_part_00
MVDGDSLLLFGGYYKEMKHKKLYDSSKSSGGKAIDDPDEPSEVGTAYNDGAQLESLLPIARSTPHLSIFTLQIVRARSVS